MVLKVFERYFGRNRVNTLLSFPRETDGIVVVPVFNDPDIFSTIDSLDACSTEAGKIGVLIVVNHSEACPEEQKSSNLRLAARIRQYIQGRQTDRLRYELLEAFDLPAKHAGVGLARKIAMDAAAAAFYRWEKPMAPILSLDADTWVESNYLDEVLCFFKRQPVAGVSIAYAHRLEGEEITPEMRDAIVKYELYLRYYVWALEYLGHPYAHACIGSAFAVRTIDYVAQGGMNKRQAGEDFYFLQKLMATGRYATLKSTRVYPSARFSERTPFGTGQTVRQIVAEGGRYLVYNLQAFRDLKVFFQEIPALYKADEMTLQACFARQTEVLRRFLSLMEAVAMFAEINANCASEEQFVKRFFDNFNAFRVLKYLNYVHENHFPKQEIREAITELLLELGLPVREDLTGILQFLRTL